MSAIVQTTSGSFDPLSLTEAKKHLRIEFDHDDSYIIDLIADAQSMVENDTWRILSSATFKLYLDRFPYQSRQINIYKSPVSAISSFEYYVDGVLTSVDSSSYYTDTVTNPARIVLKDGYAWPTNGDVRPSSVIITFTCGYSSAAEIPGPLLRALRLMVAHFYENRQPSKQGAGVSSVDVPMAYEWLIVPYKSSFF